MRCCDYTGQRGHLRGVEWRGDVESCICQGENHGFVPWAKPWKWQLNLLTQGVRFALTRYWPGALVTGGKSGMAVESESVAWGMEHASHGMFRTARQCVGMRDENLCLARNSGGLGWTGSAPKGGCSSWGNSASAKGRLYADLTALLGKPAEPPAAGHFMLPERIARHWEFR